jgi:hypothetical protein
MEAEEARQQELERRKLESRNMLAEAVRGAPACKRMGAV